MIASHNDYEMALLDLARLTRELHARIAAKHAAEQLGEAFIGLETEETHHERRTAKAA